MAVDLETVRAILEVAISNLDEPVLDYLANVIAEGDAGPIRPLVEEVAPFLVASGSAPDEAAAEELCGRLEEMLRREFGDADESCAAGSHEKTDRLEVPVRLGDLVVEPEPGYLYGEVHKSRIFVGGDPEESYAAAQTRKQHDGVCLSMRKDKFARPEYGLRPTGGERKPRVKYSWENGRPFAHDGQLKIRLPGGKNAAAVKISGTIVQSAR